VLIIPLSHEQHLLIESPNRAYDDILYLCEKYAPLDTLEKYDPEKDISVTGAYTPFTINQLQ
jgi:hypothetical protein